jgi:predicted Zn-dependent protease
VSTDVQPMGLGYEHVRDARLVENAPRWAEEAVAKLTAKSVDPGRYDLVLLPTHLWLTIHESIAHPTELDRIMGFEANYAGTSFIFPIADYLGKFRYGQNFMQIQGERSTPGGLSSIGWDASVEDLVSGIENGILIDGDGSFSIDQQRFNAQFGGQVFKEIKNGRITGPLKDVAYQMRTPEFWNGMDMIGGPSTYFLGGSFNDGKGQPSQSNAVSHGCPAARFRQVNVINTGRRA